MYHDDNKGQKANGSRKDVLQKFQEIKKGNYSPSASYNYNPTSPFNTLQTNHNHGNQNPRRRDGNHPRREGPGSSERLARQNDVIIKLLKEIRDRLPAPAQPHKSERPPRRKPETRPVNRGEAILDVQDEVSELKNSQTKSARSNESGGEKRGQDSSETSGDSED